MQQEHGPYHLSPELISLTADHVEGQGHTILFVDDEKDQVYSLEKWFRGKYNILTALSGEEALKIISTNDLVCVVASDQRMPGMQGSQLFSILQEKYPMTGRILLTAYSELSSVIEAVNKGGMDYYVSKPYQFSDLEPILRKYVAIFLLRKQMDTAYREATIHAKRL